MPLPKRAAPTDRPVIVWFRDDLRLADNRALTAAVATGQPVLAVYVFDEDSPGIRPLGGASRWWLHHSLAALAADLARHGTGLHIYRGAACALLPEVAKTAQTTAVFWSRRYGAAERAVDTAVKSALRDAGIEAESFNDHLLVEPWDIKSKAGEPFKVFTPFWRTVRALGDPPAPIGKPKRIGAAEPPSAPTPVTLDSLALLPTKPDWAGGLRETWSPGEAGARTQLSQFIAKRLPGYSTSRDRPDLALTSGLSPHLRFGEIGPRQVWHHATRAAEDGTAPHGDVEKFLSELGWREFSYHLLFHNPDLATANFDSRFDAFPWVKDAKTLHAWQRGRTGYPMVDAGLRELWHGRDAQPRAHDRGVVPDQASADRLAPGREMVLGYAGRRRSRQQSGELAMVAGSGADAAPYFRIFNPVLQGTKFDPEGTYVRRWVPELARLPAKHIHQPWETPAAILDAAGIKLGRDYPHPVVALHEGRARALAAFDKIKR